MHTHKMKVWVFQSGEPLHIDDEHVRPMRAMNLSNALVQAGHHVTLWSSDYYHQEKRHRHNHNHQCDIKLSEFLHIRLIHSRGYQNNIGLERLVDHAQLAVNLYKVLLKETELPDVVFIGYPPIETAAVLMHYLKQNEVPALLDVKDLWPVIFLYPIPKILQPFVKMALWPYFFIARKVMRDATGLSSMSNGFLEWSLDFCGRTKAENDAIFPLSSPTDHAEEDELTQARAWWDKQRIADDGCFRICFIGSLSPAFDFLPIRDAALAAQDSGEQIQFIICGRGSVAEKIKLLMNGLSNVVFPGWIDRPKIISLAERSHAALAPYVNNDDYIRSIPNKIIDSLLLGLPIISPLQGEVANVISQYHVGLRYGTDTGRTLYDCIITLMQDHELQQQMSANARSLYAEKFSFDTVYGSLVAHLEKMVAVESE